MGAISVEKSVQGVIDRIESATRDISGTFQTFDGNTLPW
jgi:norsolorinic acid ketoreductase